MAGMILPRLTALVCLLVFVGTDAGAAERRPNLVVIFCDDLGYGDLGCYGNPSIRTPQLDRMAAEGLRFTDFYAAAPVCTPSRAALLTGRYAIRSGLNNVLFPDSKGGLPQSEVTIAKALKAAGYATAHVGKWHLGIHEGQRPTDHGFDSSLGLPYSNDMDANERGKGKARDPEPPLDGFDVPLLRDGKELERPAVQTTLTQRYTVEAQRVIRANTDKPFFLYFAHTFPHTPLFASPEFRGSSRRGIYGDVVQELDWSVGQVLATLRESGVAENTLVVFTSDNGPWLTQGLQGGSAGLLKDGKGCTWEGGMRVPGLAWWPGRIKPGVTSEPASTLDLLPTLLTLAGALVPTDRPLDGADLAPLLFEGKALPERPFFYYRGTRVAAVRIGEYKAHFFTQTGYGAAKPEEHTPPLLYHLGRDPSEQYNIAAKHPEIVERLIKARDEHQSAMQPGTVQPR
ncbi:MAG: sulfatase [Planctomycetes bacterium]|nr:sulfatase [Planctomycetota bacterium]